MIVFLFFLWQAKGAACSMSPFCCKMLCPITRSLQVVATRLRHQAIPVRAGTEENIRYVDALVNRACVGFGSASCGSCEFSPAA